MTPAEQRLVVRRAYGEYAVQSACERIWRKHRREDSVYARFLAVVCRSRRESFEEFKSVAEPIIALHPKPGSARVKVSADPPKEPPPKLKRGLADLRKALTEPWPTRDRATRVEGDQDEAGS